MILLTMPTYGTVTDDAARAFYSGASTRDYKTAVSGGSLLAANFNNLWISGLNLRAEMGIRYFAMLHADCHADPGWLDILIDELDATGADLVSVVMAIKDPRGLTSTAIDTDPWKPRRLTMHEVMELPETFEASPVISGNLLVNTGCWVCRFDSEWVERHCFTINDRIVKRPDGKWMAEVQPEDWNMSRWLHDDGRKVLATRKVKARHIGSAAYSNHYAWGCLERDTPEPLTKEP